MSKFCKIYLRNGFQFFQGCSSIPIAIPLISIINATIFPQIIKIGNYQKYEITTDICLSCEHVPLQQLSMTQSNYRLSIQSQGNGNSFYKIKPNLSSPVNYAYFRIEVTFSRSILLNRPLRLQDQVLARESPGQLKLTSFHSGAFMFSSPLCVTTYLFSTETAN